MRRMSLVLLVLFLLAYPARAATVTTEPGRITLLGGVLSISSTGSIGFPAVNLDADDHLILANSAPTFTLIDARGTGAGWNISLQSSDFSAAGGRTIAAANFTVDPTGGTVMRIKGQDVDPANGPKEVGGGAVSLDTARKVVTASTNYGMGKYIWSPLATNLSLNVAAETLAGLYTATVTATISSGP